MTDSGEKQSVAGTPQAIGLISGLKGFMVWTGGSLAGITAVLYVCGYLITTAHIYTLGLYGLVDFSKDYFLLAGSKFVLTLVIGIAQAVINPVTILAATVLAPIALAVIFARGPLARTWKRLQAWPAPHAGSSWALATRFLASCALRSEEHTRLNSRH